MTTKQPVIKPTDLPIIASPEALVKGWPKPPDRSKMTTLRWAMASKEYSLRTAALHKQLVGQQVQWQLGVKDVRPVIGSEDFDFIGRSPSGVEVHVIFKRDKLAALARLRKDQTVTAIGNLATWPSAQKGQAPTLVGPGNEIRLTGISVEPTGGVPNAPLRPTRPAAGEAAADSIGNDRAPVDSRSAP